VAWDKNGRECQKKETDGASAGCVTWAAGFPLRRRWRIESATDGNPPCQSNQPEYRRQRNAELVGKSSDLLHSLGRVERNQSEFRVRIHWPTQCGRDLHLRSDV